MQLLTNEGLPLAEAGVLDAADGTLLLDVTMPGRLLRYYFGEQRRQVVLTEGGVRIRGCLATRWRASHREWRLEAAVRVELRPAGVQQARALVAA
jgi:hypothetical protein